MCSATKSFLQQHKAVYYKQSWSWDCNCQDSYGYLQQTPGKLAKKRVWEEATQVFIRLNLQCSMSNVELIKIGSLTCHTRMGGPS